MALVLSDTPAAKVWRARPEYAALPPLAGRYLLAGAALVGGAIALGFAALGAWMVLPFTGLELAALWWALRHVARSARDFEEIRLEADQLRITTCIGGELRHFEFPAYWAQVHLAAGDSGARLVIRSHGREAEIGRVLGDAQKSTLCPPTKGATRGLSRVTRRQRITNPACRCKKQGGLLKMALLSRIPRVLQVLALALLALSSGLAQADFRWNFPPPVTPIGRETLRMHNEFMVIITVLFVVVFAIMIYSMIKHRKRPGHAPAQFTGPTSRLQWFWVLVPFGILLFIDFVLMGIPAFHAVVEMEDTQTRADMVLKVTGMQWKWQYEYPDSGIKYVSTLATPRDQVDNKGVKNANYLLEVDNEVVLPVGKKVRVLLTSTDVIHTWWVPQFGVKRDAVPGFLRETWVKIEQPGVYRGQCAELCGKDHGFMPVVVRAVPEPEYLAWVDKKKAEIAAAATSGDRVWAKDELMAKGKEVYDKVCAACHQPNGQGLPPAFPALSGSKVVNTPLVSPEGKLIKDGHIDRVLNGKPGTAMQAFKTQLSDVELAAVITYERNSFGNTRGDLAQPSQIKALR